MLYLGSISESVEDINKKKLIKNKPSILSINSPN